jgi:hypothetical protein
VRLEGLGQLKKIHLIGTRTSDFPACSIVPQSTTLPRTLGTLVQILCFWTLSSGLFLSVVEVA